MPKNKKADNKNQETVKKVQEELQSIQKKYNVVIAPVLVPSMNQITAELKIFTKEALNEITNGENNSNPKKDK